MSEPIPLHQNALFEFDEEREMLDYLMGKVRKFTRETGGPPDSVAVVMIRKEDEDGRLHTMAHSWSPRDSRSRFETCSIGSMLLTERALKGD